MTKKQVETILRTVMDPELNVNIVDLGLIYEIEILRQSGTAHSSRSAQDDKVALKSLATSSNKQAIVSIVMTLTTPGCPLGGWFVEQVRLAVVSELKLKPDQVMVEITFDPPWSQELMGKEAREKLGF